jgi:prepilin-type N-terminal cleavage/methylation domain-containing protein
MKQTRKAFTLIELLIVVAIIAILAAIAVPNFLEAQVRSKVSRAKSDMRTIKTGLEAYRVDNNSYIQDLYSATGTEMWGTWAQLTTPIAYITSVPPSPFRYKDYLAGGYNKEGQPPYDYGTPDSGEGSRMYPLKAYGIGYIIDCAGPDEDIDYTWYPDVTIEMDARSGPGINMVYDPTNGTKSSGDIIASNKAIY